MSRHRDLDTLAHRIDRAATTVPEVIDHLNEQRALVPALAASSTNAGSSGDHSDPTLRTLLALDRIEGHRRTIHDAIATLGVCVDMLDDACRAALGYRTPDAAPQPEPDKPLCIASKNDLWAWTEAELDEGRGLCHRNAESYRREDGTVGYRAEMLCPMHRKRKERSERENAA